MIRNTNTLLKLICIQVVKRSSIFHIYLNQRFPCFAKSRALWLVNCFLKESKGMPFRFNRTLELSNSVKIQIRLNISPKTLLFLIINPIFKKKMDNLSSVQKIVSKQMILYTRKYHFLQHFNYFICYDEMD